MKRVALLLVIGGLAGCATRPTPAIAPPVRGTAVLQTDVTATETEFMGGEIRCRLQSIDGNTVGDSPELTPGRHTVIANLKIQDRDHVGVVSVLIPAARTYRLRARGREEAVTVTLEEVGGGIIASSTAPLEEQMTFNVFVVQN